MDEKIAVLTELIEQSCEANKLLLSNAISMENGEIEEAQKHLKSATQIIDVMVRDVFVEVKEAFEVESDDEDDYDYSVLDLSKLLVEVTKHAGNLLSYILSEESDTIMNIAINKLTSSINAASSLALAILLN